MSVSFVPQYSQKLSDPQEAQGFANQIFSLLFWFFDAFLSIARYFHSTGTRYICPRVFREQL
ncbi:integral membrane MviN domain protein [Anaplasma phagocytophilum str. CRT53-1]|uniref:Integral membrane MviN domain protein n=1 Tax=Anaplasma phagocytophilum str. CRT53-1 TaxID=1359157 RepID=A0A0F3PIF4_ANAPH|nr:integral membrane MviN domain protein [Anaplasma phagocytophilum str. CRT53-1]